MIPVPEYVRSIRPYVPGKPVEELERELGIKEAIKLASNENPLGPSPKAKEAILSATKNLNRYPDGGGYYLRKALAERLKIEMDEVILGNGSNELIDIAVRTFMTPDDEAVMGTPSFVVYPMAVQALGAKAIQVPLRDYRHDLDAMADSITPQTRIVFVANPNNPTGTINYSDEFDRFMENVPEGVLVVVDEAYYEYVQDSRYPDTMRYFRDGRDILILRTFSKIYGLAGLRIGYGIGKREILEEMNKIREPFNTNSLAQAAALMALDDQEHVRRSIEINEQGKEYLYREFNRLGLKYLPTEANFIFVVLDGIDAQDLYRTLLRDGIIVRPMGERYLRITIGLPEENRALVEALERHLG